MLVIWKTYCISFDKYIQDNMAYTFFRNRPGLVGERILVIFDTECIVRTSLRYIC